MDGFPKQSPERQTVLVRAVNAMVRAMGGGSVRLRLPSSAPLGLERELGIAPSLEEEIEIGPVVVRTLEAKEGRARVQLVIAASSLDPVMVARGESNGYALLKNAVSMMYGDCVFRVTEVSTEEFGGLEYMWRVTGVE